MVTRRDKPESASDPTVMLGQPSKSADAPTLSGVVPASVLASARPPLVSGTAVGRYILLEPLGEGGMGVVYAAQDPELGRRVALKLLRPEMAVGEGSASEFDGRSRLVREAHAMAKLSHPNVVAIYDSGMFEDQVFLAMELVEGLTLRAWLAAAPRSWREILDVFLRAGRGLHAAHAAGLVHRDFKPDNVLIGSNGDVKVTDFGLARAAEPRSAQGAPRAESQDASIGLDPLSTPLTRAGAVSGTPAYMSPEQMLGGGTDARTDEFSFCVALYRSLYGELPFVGKLDPYGQNEIKPPPKGTAVPAWVRRPLLRGLAIRPEERYPDLHELLDALSDDPALKRRRAPWVAVVTVLVAAGMAGTSLYLARARAASNPCHDPEGKLAGVWDDAVRSRVRAAFEATGARDAASTVAYAEKAMDRASGAWLAAYQDACQATWERHTQPESALNLRLDCLEEQRFDLRAVAELMAHPDAKKLFSVIGSASTLPVPSECLDARALSVIDQPAPERRARVDALRLRLAQGVALAGANKSADAIDILTPLPDEAVALDARSLEARAVLALAHAYANRSGGGQDDHKKASELYLRAESLAEAARMDPLATEAAAELAMYKVALASPRADVDRALTRAEDDLRRVGNGGIAEYYVERAVSVVALFRGENTEAAVHARRAFALADSLFLSTSRESLSAANNLAAALEPLGQYDELVQLLRRASEASDAIMGPGSRRALVQQVNLVEVSFYLGRASEAQQALDQLFPRMSPDADRGELALALGLEAVLQASRGERRASLASVARALEMATRLDVLASAEFVDLHRYVIEADLRDGEPKSALEDYEKYLAHQDLAADSPSWVASLRLGGWAYLDAGQATKALPILERALALSSAHPFYPGWVARLRYQSARCLVATHGDRTRAEAAALAAHDELVDVPVAQDLLKEVDAWRLATFAKPPR
jgi:hypothetical protein